jgi:hypothetical protein
LQVTAQHLKQRDDELWARWWARDPDSVRDGIQDYEKYLSQPCRILFVLKEVNGFSSTASLRKFLRDGALGGGKTWNNVTRWTREILDGASWADVAKVSQEDRREHLARVAVINVKKLSGGAVAVNDELWEAARRDSDLLTEQLELYNPHLIISCGWPVDQIVNDLMRPKDRAGYHESAHGVWYSVGRVGTFFLTFKHPAVRRQSHEALYHQLIRTVAELRPPLP